MFFYFFHLYYTIFSETFIYLREVDLETSTNEKLKPIKELSVAKAFLVLPFRWSSLKSLCGYLYTVVTKFFWLQFSVKLGLRKIPVLPVDNALDKKVPFNPLKVPIYLDFIHFWVRPMVFIINKFGTKKAVPYCAKFFAIIDKSYQEAARIYSFRMSTTDRPMCKVDKSVQRHFNTIRTVDPHYLCVPSLHIAIVVLAYTFFRQTFKELEMDNKEQDFYNAELYRGALDIAETVLYVKQHSVNCIPAALFMMTNLIPEYFKAEDARIFINDLFKDCTDIQPEDKINIHNHIKNMYENLLQEKGDKDWTEPVKNWIVNYIPS